MFRFYDLVSKVTHKGALKHDIRSYMARRILEAQNRKA